MCVHLKGKPIFKKLNISISLLIELSKYKEGYGPTHNIIKIVHDTKETENPPQNLHICSIMINSHR